MKVHLLYRDRDFDTGSTLSIHDEALIEDLGLETIISTMAREDSFTREVARKVILTSVTDVATLLYRQAVLQDCLKYRDVITALYHLVVEAIEAERRELFGSLARSPSSVLFRGTSLLESLTGTLRTIRAIAGEQVDTVASEGLHAFFRGICSELDDAYFVKMQAHLKQLRFPNGVLMGAQLGEGNKGAEYVLLTPPVTHKTWMEQLFEPRPPSYTFHIADRDEMGARALDELRMRALGLVARALGQATDHILNFLRNLRWELAYYLGCVRLQEALTTERHPTCFPNPVEAHERQFAALELYDVPLALSQGRVVSNDFAADGRSLVIITGANQGGKSTFLRSVGIAHVMMQCGMFVGAQSFRANIAERLFTHFKRPEDATMKSGKFDEELHRMSAIADCLIPNALVLFNESFASTNELEGSEIAEHIVNALLEREIKILFVTHQFEFADRFLQGHRLDTLFLRAERREDGTRTFKVVEGDPLKTSFGADLYREIFGTSKSNGNGEH